MSKRSGLSQSLLLALAVACTGGGSSSTDAESCSEQTALDIDFPIIEELKGFFRVGDGFALWVKGNQRELVFFDRAGTVESRHVVNGHFLFMAGPSDAPAVILGQSSTANREIYFARYTPATRELTEFIPLTDDGNFKDLRGALWTGDEYLVLVEDEQASEVVLRVSTDGSVTSQFELEGDSPKRVKYLWTGSSILALGFQTFGNEVFATRYDLTGAQTHREPLVRATGSLDLARSEDEYFATVSDGDDLHAVRFDESLAADEPITIAAPDVEAQRMSSQASGITVGGKASSTEIAAFHYDRAWAEVSSFSATCAERIRDLGLVPGDSSPSIVWTSENLIWHEAF